MSSVFQPIAGNANGGMIGGDGAAVNFGYVAATLAMVALCMAVWYKPVLMVEASSTLATVLVLSTLAMVEATLLEAQTVINEIPQVQVVQTVINERLIE